jgi:hypothetical protein
MDKLAGPKNPDKRKVAALPDDAADPRDFFLRRMPTQERQPPGPYPFRWRYSPPAGQMQSSGSADSTADFQIDTTSGMDEAIRRGDMLSDAVASHRSMLYGNGGPLDIGSLMGSAERIRALKSYLSAYGTVSESMPHPIKMPMTRIAGGRIGTRSGANASSSATTGGWDAYQ